jgi:capsule biosynthesis phosphatase
MKKIVIDLDGTLTIDSDAPYEAKKPNTEVIEQLKRYASEGFYIVVMTARNMRTYESNIGKINVYTLPKVIDWLKKHEVPFDEVIVGKPWCGFDGFYVDDKAIRPSEFTKHSHKEIMDILAKENPYKQSGNE